MSQIYTRNPVVVLREEFDDWAILFNPDNAEAVGANPMGVDIWKKIDGKASVADILDSIRKEYNNVSATAGTEVEEFIQQLLQRGLIGVSTAL